MFVCEFNMTIKVSGMLEPSVKDQYLSTLVRGEYFFQFDSLSDDMESSNTLTVEDMFLRLGS